MNNPADDFSLFADAADSMAYLPITELQEGYSYQIYANNAYVGVWDAQQRNFIISRYKVGDNPYLCSERHHDADGTAKPIKIIEKCPLDYVVDRTDTKSCAELINYLNKLEEDNPIITGHNSLQHRKNSAIRFENSLAGRDTKKPTTIPVYILEKYMHQPNYRIVYIVTKQNSGAIWRDGFGLIYKVENHPTNDLQAHLESVADAYISKQPEFVEVEQKLDPDVFKGLQQSQQHGFPQKIVEQLEKYMKTWNQPTFVRFGITGLVGEGKSGQPNYQIETEDGKEKIPFRHNHQKFEREEFDKEFNENKITKRLSLQEIKTLWSLK
ncbi:MAG: hypothetical protein KDI39_06960 [Pseudomonadales bacterium]|nr:hypothetical protein [Pseudomonadales bacterium]